MRIYGLVNEPLRKVVEIYATEDDAELGLERVLANEPDWADDVAVHALELDLEHDAIRLRSSAAALIDVTFEALPAGRTRYLGEPKRRQPRRRTSGSG